MRRVLGGVAAIALGVSACGPATSVPDALIGYPQLVLHNAKILTMDRDDDSATVAEALAIRDGKILAVGTNADVLRLAGPGTRRENLEGNTVIPGIIDTHTHIMDYAIDRKAADLGLSENVTPRGDSWEQVKSATLALLRQEAPRRRPGEWIRVRWPENAIGADGQPADVKVVIVNGIITRRELDAVTPDNPVLLRGSTRTVFNSRAIEVMKQLYGGYDEEMNLETGISVSVIIGRALDSDAMAEFPRLVRAYRDEMLRWASYGVTTWSSSVSGLKIINAFAELDRRGEMPIRFAYTQGQGTTASSAESASQFYAHLPNTQGLGSDRLWDIGVSVVNLDGSYPQMKTSIAAPASIKSREISFSAPGESRRRILDAQLLAGFRIAGVHIAGDRALDDYLDAIEAASKARGLTADQVRAMRHAADHCAFNPRPDQFARLKALGIFMSCGPKYIAGNSAGATSDYGPQYARWVAPVRSLLRVGVRTVYESDVDDLDRFGALYLLETLVTRADRSGRIWTAEEKVDRMTALRMATRWAAEYVLREQVLGSIEPGKFADLVVLDRDYATVPENQISQIKVLKTVVGGKTVYERP